MDYNTDVSIDDDDIVEYIRENFEIDDVFTDDVVKEHISKHFLPEDVFDEKSLAIWAADHGFVKEYTV